MQTYKLSNKKTLKIVQDSDVSNPRVDQDNLGQMVCFHSRYDLGDKHSIKTSDYSGWTDMMKQNTKKGDIVLPLYLYDHSGLSISTKPFHCPWDSGQIGFIKLSLEKIRKEYGRATKKNIELATKVLLSEVETYNQYLNGEVYSFILEDSQGEVEDSCSGFYGSDIQSNGILDHLSKEDVEAFKKCS